MRAVRVENLTWKYSNTTKPAIQEIHLEIEENTFTGIVGPNESGKTTLVSCIKGLIPRNFSGIWQGKVELFGLDIASKTSTELAQEVGFVFADPEAQFTAMSVEEEIAFGMENIGLTVPEIRERIAWVSELTMIGDLLEKSPYDISGGQKQRVAIASVLAMKPRILILDEPTSMLDPLGKDTVFEILRRMKKELNMTIIIIEHSLERLSALCDRILLVHNGRLLKDGTAAEFFDDIPFLVEHGLNPPDGMRFLSFLMENRLYTGKAKVAVDDIVSIGRSILASGGDS